jgi:hypothetical protein
MDGHIGFWHDESAEKAEICLWYLRVHEAFETEAASSSAYVLLLVVASCDLSQQKDPYRVEERTASRRPVGLLAIEPSGSIVVSKLYGVKLTATVTNAWNVTFTPHIHHYQTLFKHRDPLGSRMFTIELQYFMLNKYKTHYSCRRAAVCDRFTWNKVC